MSPSRQPPLVFITGASSGIGQALAARYARAGWRLALSARRGAELDAWLQAAGIGPERGAAYAADVRDVDGLVAAGRACLAAQGLPDVVIASAGISVGVDTAERGDLDVMRAIFEINNLGLAATFHAFLPAMRERGSGHLITIGSVADRNIFPGNAAYSASKYGLRALHEVLQAELRGTGVRTTLVSPGPVDTELWDPIDPDNRAGFTPRAQMLTAAEVAEAIQWAIAAPVSVNIGELRLSRS